MAAKEYFGINEEEAVQEAALDLGIPREKIRYTLIETRKKGLFFKGGVRIAVLDENDDDPDVAGGEPALSGEEARAKAGEVVDFLNTLIGKMGMSGTACISSLTGDKLLVAIESRDSSLLIGKMGKTLDALQVVANIVGQKGGERPLRVIVDCENYRERRQQKLVSFAEEVADHVRRTRSSRLLEPMNPFERRLVHTALTRYEDIETVSEGDGLYKQIRIRFRGQGRR
ncbi:MAG: protein jag [Spirochaetales bacterium]|nr:protein jag [Spirochaetales bacterium]